MNVQPTPELLHQFLRDNKDFIMKAFEHAMSIHPDKDAIVNEPTRMRHCENFFFAGVATLFMQAQGIACDEAMPLPEEVRSAETDDGPW